MAEVNLNPAMTRHVEKEWKGAERLPDLIAAAEAVERLQEHPGWVVLERVLGREVELISNGLERRTALENAGEYAKQHGRVGGLRGIGEAADAVVGVARRRRERAEEEVAARVVAARENDDAAESGSERMAA